jgi:hypothetical protein
MKIDGSLSANGGPGDGAGAGGGSGMSLLSMQRSFHSLSFIQYGYIQVDLFGLSLMR